MPVVVVLALAACGPTSTDPASAPQRRAAAGTGTSSSAARGAPGPLRTDLSPLTKRFPALGTPVSATWQTGIVGSTRAPGPSSFWIDAAVRVTPEVMAALRSTGSLSATSAPDVSPGVRSALPGGPWLAGPDLDRAFATGGFGGRAFLAPDSATVVLLVVGGN